MDKKLTLNLDQQVIEKAKRFAKANNISLSKLIENYLQFLVQPRKEDEEITPLVKSLSGVIELPEDFDLRDKYSDFLVKKYR